MESDLYPQRPLVELTEIYDSMRVPVKKSQRKPGPYPYYGASGIADYVDSYIFDGEYLLLAEDGENLKTQNTPLAFMATGKFWVNNHAHILKENDFSDTRFLCYALQIADIHSYLSGSTRPKLTQGDMKRIPVFAPSQPTQRAIAHILRSLDDKVELNRKMNETLEAMAQAIFKSWFIDFDPVIDKALAAGNPIPEELQGRAAIREALGNERKPLPEDIRKLFPSEFELTEEMGWVPKGWKLGCLGDIADQKRRSIQPGAIRLNSPYIGLEHMPRRSIALSDWSNAESVGSNKYEFKQGEILFGKLRPYFHKVGVAPVDGVCSTDIVVMSPKKTEWFGYLLGHVSSVEFVDYTNAGSTGTRMPRTSWKEMARYDVSLPPKLIGARFSEICVSLIDKILPNIDQSNNIQRLRDTLLPKLISGELRIPDAEKLVEEVL